MKKLKDAAQGLQRFLDAVEVLGKKLGPILFQLPPNWELDAERLDSFLALLPRHHRYAFEFRNPTWETDRVYELLRRYNIAHCAFDLAGYRSPVLVTADYAYVRLHGPGGRYQGSYNDNQLHEWAARIREWKRMLAAIFVYFDNDDSGFAARDAQRLKELDRAHRD